MKILILEPFYTSFHIDLAKYLSDDIYSFVFDFGNIIYLLGSKKIYVNNHILKESYSPDDLVIAEKTKNLYSEKLKKIEGIKLKKNNLKYMARYISYLRNFLKEEKIDLVTMHNDLRWQHALSIQVCKELNLKYIVTERGIFRPNTITVDFKGVNANSSLPKNKEFYKKAKIHKKSLINYRLSKIIILKTNIKFVIFILFSKIGQVLKINCQIKNKEHSFLKYMNIFVRQQVNWRRSKNINLPRRYIFVPIQVNEDTQILVHSDFNNMQEFISKVENDVYSLDSDLSLVFKIHPMESGAVRYKFNDKSIVVDTDIARLIKDSEFVVTINSTVGLEAIQLNKVVLVLGESFFKIDGIVICSSKDSFRDDLIRIINKKIIIVDIESMNSFMEYLMYKYQVNGNLFNYNNTTMKELAKRIRES